MGVELIRTCMPVKPQFIKDLSLELREQYPDAFSPHFEHNKEVVLKLTNIESKVVQNRVAGHITRQKANGTKPEGGLEPQANNE